MLDSDVNMMVASAVASAVCTSRSGATMPSASKIITRKGTSTIPPPTPSRPARKPPPHPISSSISTVRTDMAQAPFPENRQPV